MDRAQVLQLVRDRSVELLGVEADDVQEDRSFLGDLEVDSLALVELTMALEDDLDVELTGQDVRDARTIGAFVDAVLARTGDR